MRSTIPRAPVWLNTSLGKLFGKEFSARMLVVVASLPLTLSACGGGSGNAGGGSPAPSGFVVSGTVSAPGGVVAMFTEKNLFDRLSDAIFSAAYAAISGIANVPDGTRVELIRIDDAGAQISVLATATTTGGRYSFN